ncbi:MAG TPA: START domain-containing protein [bacterium]|nr:START domain-containing protein [bacterium]
MRRLFLLTAILVLAVGTSFPAWGAATKEESKLAATVDESKFAWKKSCNTEGLTIYWSKVEGSQVIAFKGEGIVDAPIEKVASIIIDTTRGTEWIDSLVSSKVVRNVSPTEFIEYDHVGIAFPFDQLMSDRDFVSHVYLVSDPETKRVKVSYLPAEDELAPPVKKYTRGVMSCVFKMVPMSIGEETYVEAEIHCDPKGGVPKWVVNFFQQGWPQTTFENLRRQAKKTDIQTLPVVENLLQKHPVKLAKKPSKKTVK